MKQAMAAGLSVCALAGAAFSQAAHAQSGPSLFISPMGEAFRADDAHASPLDAWIAAIDTDGEGRISRDEYMADVMRFFQTLDRNQDGTVTSLESTYYWSRQAPEMFDEHAPLHRRARVPDDDANPDEQAMIERHRAAGHYNHADEPMRGAQPFSLLNDVEPVLSCDRNFDRRVSSAEFQACAEQRFAQIDIDHDGAFTRAEADWPKF